MRIKILQKVHTEFEVGQVCNSIVNRDSSFCYVFDSKDSLQGFYNYQGSPPQFEILRDEPPKAPEVELKYSTNAGLGLCDVFNQEMDSISVKFK